MSEDKSARQVLATLDKVLAKPATIIAVCERSAKIAERCSTPEKRLQRTAQLIIMHYSNLCAIGGGASGLPGMIPGIGLIYSLLGSVGIDAFLNLKFNIEMSLALSHLAGFDITDPRERKLAFILACAAIADAFEDDKDPSLARIIDIATNEYSTSELTKTLIKALARVIILFNAKKLTRFFPVISMGIEASINKAKSAKLGRECWKAYKLRRDAQMQTNTSISTQDNSNDE